MTDDNNTTMPIPTALNTIQFSEYIDIIKMLYREDDDFKTLCDDYNTSKSQLEKYKGKSIEDMRSELEYQQLSLDLEKEILDYIRKRTGSDG